MMTQNVGEEINEMSSIIEIGLEEAPFVVFVYFSPHLNM